jgi:hypothetical protein
VDGGMSVPVRVRMEILKRDRFTCAYCGAHPPDVLLEVDHIVPRAAGGTDDPQNLTTACWNCNRGKADRLLDEGTAPAMQPATLEAMAQRLEQAKAYVELLTQLSSVTDSMAARVNEEWARAFSARSEERESGHFWVLDGGATWPKEATLRVFLRELDLEQIIGAIDMAASRVGCNPGNDRYFYAICWRMVREKRAAQEVPRDDERVLELEIRNGRLADELGEAHELIRDLQVNIRRLREEAGRQ